MTRGAALIAVTAAAILLGFVLLMFWREIAAFLAIAGAAALLWRFKFLVLIVLGIDWLFGGDDCDI